MLFASSCPVLLVSAHAVYHVKPNDPAVTSPASTSTCGLVIMILGLNHEFYGVELLHFFVDRLQLQLSQSYKD